MPDGPYPMASLDDAQVEKLLDEFFEDNYRQLLADGGAHILTPRALEQARQQARYYWRKMRDVAVSVTETEVRLQLPNQRTPRGRNFVIEGVVDLVREQERIRMYDIKTHYCDEVKNSADQYAAQLNVYAYIWRELRGQELHSMGIIAVQLPEGLREALRNNDHDAIREEVSKWHPLVPFDYDVSSIEEVFEEIADTVDRIEDGEFSPAPPERLRELVAHDGGRPVRFATLHCRNCDGRFSCDSYREYVANPGRGRPRFDMQKYLPALADDGEGDEWIDGNIEPDIHDAFVAEPELVPRRRRRTRQRAAPRPAARRTSGRQLPVNIPWSGARLRSLLERLESDYSLTRARVARGCGVKTSTLNAYCSKDELPAAFREKLRVFLLEAL